MTGFKDGSVRWKQRQKIEAVGEQAFFDKYIQLGNVRQTLAHFGLETAHQAFYDWLHEEHTDSTTGRWDRWNKAKAIRGSLEFDQVYEETETIDNANVARVREKVKALQWRAERLNPKEYGKPDQHINLAVGTPDQWLSAIAKSQPSTELPSPSAPRLSSGTRLGAREVSAGSDPDDSA